MVRFSVLVAEDNPCDREWLLACIARRGELRLDGVAMDGGEAIALVQEKAGDLMFLAIHSGIDMPLSWGLDVLARSAGFVSPAIVVTSANPSHAVDAFEYDALDFLGKPFSEARFDKAVDRFLAGRKAAGMASMPDPRMLRIKGKGYLWLIPLDDIQFISSHGRLSDLHCRDGDKVVSLLLSQVMALLPGDSFVRIHRQYVVNSRCLASLKSDVTGKHSVLLHDEDGTVLPVGRAYLSMLRLMME